MSTGDGGPIDEGPYGGGGDLYGGDIHDGGGGWAAPAGPPSDAAPPRRRTGLVLAVLAGAVLLLVAAATVVALTRTDDAAADGFGAGPTREPEERWTVDLGTEDGSGVTVRSDGDVVYVVRDVPYDDYGDDDESYYDDPGIQLRAFDAGDGEELWDIEIESGFGFGGPVQVLPGGRVLVSGGVGGETTRLLESRTGEEVWEADGGGSGMALGLGLLFGQPSTDVPDDHVVLATYGDQGPGSASVVDLDTGGELWSEEGVEAVDCGEVVLVLSLDGEAMAELQPTEADISARDPETGEEAWTIEGYPGPCVDGVVAVATDPDEVVLVEVRTGARADPIDVGDAAELLQAVPFGDHVLVGQVSYRDAEQPPRSAIYHRRGGEPTWEGDGIATPITDELVLSSAFNTVDATLIRARDGEDLGEPDFVPREGGEACEGSISTVTALSCSEDSSEVGSYSVADGLEERWTIDVGADVVNAAVGGDQLFVATAAGELVAYR